MGMSGGGIAVLLGAGASFDCADPDLNELNNEFTPPLAVDLFRNKPSFNNILTKYPKAEALSADIRSAVLAKKNLEEVLRGLQDSSDLITRRMFFQVPLYL